MPQKSHNHKHVCAVCAPQSCDMCYWIPQASMCQDRLFCVSMCFWVFSRFLGLDCYLDRLAPFFSSHDPKGEFCSIVQAWTRKGTKLPSLTFNRWRRVERDVSRGFPRQGEALRALALAICQVSAMICMLTLLKKSYHRPLLWLTWPEKRNQKPRRKLKTIRKQECVLACNRLRLLLHSYIYIYICTTWYSYIGIGHSFERIWTSMSASDWTMLEPSLKDF